MELSYVHIDSIFSIQKIIIIKHANFLAGSLWSFNLLSRLHMLYVVRNELDQCTSRSKSRTTDMNAQVDYIYMEPDLATY